MRSLALLLPLVAASAPALPLPSPHTPQSDGQIHVDVVTEDGDYLISLRAESAPLNRVLDKLATHIGYDVEGLEGAARPSLVTVHLELRPLSQVLEYLVGSVGLNYRLRAGTITVLPDETGQLDQDGLLQLASVAYLRALTRHPGHGLAPGARLDQGKVAELRGFPGAAIDHYQSLIEEFTRAPEVPEALMRSGLVYQSMGRWADAAEQFRVLANIQLAKDYAEVSRLQLARCTIEIGDAESGLFLLSVLDQDYPVRSGQKRDSRELIRALALVRTQRHLEALRTLESVERNLQGDDRIEGLRVRALALQGAGSPGDAGRAWLLYSEQVGEPLRGDALEQAVRLALAGEDEIGALFVVRQAETYGHEQRFAPYKTEAYSRLGFKTQPDPQETGAAERISLAEKALLDLDYKGATGLVESLIIGASALQPDERVRLAGVWSECVHQAQGVDPAVDYLRGLRDGFIGDVHFDARARLDVMAATRLETDELYDRAADAYRGIY